MKTLLAMILVISMASTPVKKQETYILVHGAWHGAWCWNNVTPIMKKMGMKPVTVDLPGSGQDSTIAVTITLDDYVAEVMKIANQQAGPVILVGHSMAGVVIAQAAEKLGPGKISKLIFLDAFMPSDGESVLALAGVAQSNPKKREGLSLMACLEFSNGQKASRVKTDMAKPLFYGDCSAKDVDFAIQHLGWQPMAPLATPVHVTASRYGEIPKYYILCTKSNDLDKSVLADHVPCRKVVTLDSSHSPFFSMPDKLVHALADL